MAGTVRGNAPGSSGRNSNFVLVVDSDAQSLVFMSMILQRLEYPVCSALGVGNALEIASASVPALVITELNLRGMNGLELIHGLRQAPRTRAVPVIVMTNELTAHLEQQCREAGALSCIGKPVQANELFRLIHPVMDPESRRKNIRIQTRLNVFINDHPLDCAEGECASMLSTKGMYVRTLRPYDRETQVHIRIELNEETLAADARVIYCHTFGEGPFGTPGMGLQFLTITPHERELIRRFINEEVSHGIAPGWEETERS
jgi:CheY-like chemotaxis protein